MKNLSEILGVILFGVVIIALCALTKISNDLHDDSIQRESASRLISELDARSVALGSRYNHPISEPVFGNLPPGILMLDESAEHTQIDAAIILEPLSGMQQTHRASAKRVLPSGDRDTSTVRGWSEITPDLKDEIELSNR